MTVLTMAWRLFAKDVRVELRTGEVTVTSAIFAIIVTVIVSMSFWWDPTTGVRMAAGVLWISLAFSGVLVMTRVWAREREGDVMRALLMAPVPRASIYLGKAGASLLFLTAVEIIIVPLVAILFQLDLWACLDKVLALLALGTLGFIAAGTLFGAMTVQGRARDFVFTMVFFPLSSPALLAGVSGTRDALLGRPWSEITDWLALLGAFLLISLTAGVALFDPLTSE